MKLLPAFLATLALLAAGYAGGSGKSSANPSPNIPAGTQVGTSYPGVNQPTTTTEAARSDSATDNVPNSRR